MYHKTRHQEKKGHIRIYEILISMCTMLLENKKKRKSENQDLGGRVEEKSVAEVNKMEVDKSIELLQQAVLDLSLDVEYLMTQI